MGRWTNRELVPESGAGRDMLLGRNNRPGGAKERRRTPRSAAGEETLRTVADWATATGGGYFFVSAVAALRRAGQAEEGTDAADR